MMTKNHQAFLEYLKASKEGVLRAAEWLTSLGYQVELGDMSKFNTEGHSSWRKFVDGGDLFVIKGQERKRIEVKRLTYHFTCSRDWPFRARYIVCAKHQWDMADPKPHRYFSFNPSMSHIAIVNGSTNDRWYVEKVADRRYEGAAGLQDKYLCPLSLVKFMEVRL